MNSTDVESEAPYFLVGCGYTLFLTLCRNAVPSLPSYVSYILLPILTTSLVLNFITIFSFPVEDISVTPDKDVYQPSAERAHGLEASLSVAKAQIDELKPCIERLKLENAQLQHGGMGTDAISERDKAENDADERFVDALAAQHDEAGRCGEEVQDKPVMVAQRLDSHQPPSSRITNTDNWNLAIDLPNTSPCKAVHASNGAVGSDRKLIGEKEEREVSLIDVERRNTCSFPVRADSNASDWSLQPVREIANAQSQAAKDEEMVRKRCIDIIDIGLAICKERGYFRSTDLAVEGPPSEEGKQGEADSGSPEGLSGNVDVIKSLENIGAGLRKEKVNILSQPQVKYPQLDLSAVIEERGLSTAIVPHSEKLKGYDKEPSLLGSPATGSGISITSLPRNNEEADKNEKTGVNTDLYDSEVSKSRGRRWSRQHYSIWTEDFSRSYIWTEALPEP